MIKLITEDIAVYLMRNYYSKYPLSRRGMVPNFEILNDTLNRNLKNVVVVSEAGDICGVGIYLRLNDETYGRIRDLNLYDEKLITKLLMERGLNFHFILISASGAGAIIRGLTEVKTRRPKTISWWSPYKVQFHEYHLSF